MMAQWVMPLEVILAVAVQVLLETMVVVTQLQVVAVAQEQHHQFLVLL
jgi:hypothetical protein